jgi:methylenetetrahydrofolate dehydrogenase (NADP+)/methenyltetrahydrofolate cyclohydrolase
MTVLLDGKKVALELEERCKARVAALSFKPVLTIIQIGNKEESSVYVRQKIKAGARIGVEVRHIIFAEDVVDQDVIDLIDTNNQDTLVSGIILQLPLPEHLNSNVLIDSILPTKDVDGMTATSVKLLFNGEHLGILPATTRGIMFLLNYYNISVLGKKVLMIGRSKLVGRPTALELLSHGATVTIAHRGTRDLLEEVRRADIVVSAIGVPKFFTRDYFTKGQVVIDVGISRLQNKLVGDVDFDGLQGVVAAITPVPGGVGPLTVISLFVNLLDIL